MGCAPCAPGFFRVAPIVGGAGTVAAADGLPDEFGIQDVAEYLGFVATQVPVYDLEQVLPGFCADVHCSWGRRLLRHAAAAAAVHTAIRRSSRQLHPGARSCSSLLPSPQSHPLSTHPLQLALGGDLGSGTFGSVRRASLPDGRAFALKMPRGTEDRRSALRLLCSEVRGLRLVRGLAHVLPLEGLVEQDGEFVGMLTPVCNAGTLWDIAK